MPARTKGKHVFRPSNSVLTAGGSAPQKNASKQPRTTKAQFPDTTANNPSNVTSGTTGPLPAHNHNENSDNPNSLAPLTPSTYLSCPRSFGGNLTTSSLITSVSCQKCKVSALAEGGSVVGSDSGGSHKRSHLHALASTESVVGSKTGSRKRSQPLSVTQQAQVDTSKSMQKLSVAFQNFYQEYTSDHRRNPPPSATAPTAPASGSTMNESDITHAAAQALAELALSPEDMIDIAEHLQDEKNKKAVLYFLAFPPATRLSWVERRLKEIHSDGSSHPLDNNNI